MIAYKDFQLLNLKCNIFKIGAVDKDFRKLVDSLVHLNDLDDSQQIDLMEGCLRDLVDDKDFSCEIRKVA